MDAPLASMLRVQPDDAATMPEQIAAQIRELIASRRLVPGERLPSSRRLAAALNVSRNSVLAAMEQLAAEGYIETSLGRRATVAAGLDLAGGAVRAKAGWSKAAPVRVSAWARHLKDAGWPPAYDGVPRPFQPGLADAREFPHEVWGRCLRHAADRARRRGQGAHNQSPNRPELQEALLRHLADHRGIKAAARQLIIVPAAQTGIALIAKVLLGEGDVAWMESPGYGGAKAAFLSAGARVQGIRLDAGGLRIGGRKASPRAVFVTPSHQYPTARLMPVAHRLELLQFAERAGAAIIEDDYDGEFHYEGRPVAALQGLAEGARVFYVGTFAKAMFTDVRVGYVVVPDDLVEIFEAAQRHLGALASVTLQDALAEFIDMGAYRAHVRRMTRIYRRRRDCMLGAIATAAGDRLAIEAPAGGMQLAARCTRTMDDRVLSARLGEAGLIARPLSSLYFGTTTEQGLFLGFAAWNETEIERASAILGRTVREL